MADKPKIRRPSRLFALLIGILLVIIAVIFVGRNISHLHEKEGAPREPNEPCRLNC